MKNKLITGILALAFIAIPLLSFVACNDVDGDVNDTPQPSQPVTYEYYLGASWSGYAADGTPMTKVSGTDNLYICEVTLKESDEDPMYGSHFYKVTNGTWEQAWGAANYELQPAPAYIGEDGRVYGMGSIYIKPNYDENGEMNLTVLFDSEKKIIYDNTMKITTPRIYGDFNSAMNMGSNWSLKKGETLLLEEETDGLFRGVFKIPAYEGSGDGYALNVVTEAVYSINLPNHGWSVVKQYKLDGSVGGMGLSSYIKPLADTNYEFTFDPETKITTYTHPEQDDLRTLDLPVLYGELSGWNITKKGAYVMQPVEGEEGKYEVEIFIPYGYYTQENGFDFQVVTSLKFWDTQWGIGWGADIQYNLNGRDPNGAGINEGKTYILLTEEEEGMYRFVFNSATKVTTYEKVQNS